MEMYRAEVCLGGLITNTVVKEEVTAAEIVILRGIHGDDAIKSIKPLGNKNRTYQKEFDRLQRAYGKAKVAKSFPGARPILPQKLADVGIIVNENGNLNEEVIAKGPNNKNVKTAREKTLADLGIEGDDDSDDDEGDQEE